MFNGGEFGTWGDPTDEVWGTVVGVSGTQDAVETGRSECRAVREWLGTIESGEHGAPDDPVVVASVGTFAVDGPTDPLAQLVEARGSEGDLVGAVGRAPRDDLGADRAAQGLEPPRDHRAPVELHVH